MYADDIVLIAESESDLQEMISVVFQYSVKWRFELSESKTEIVVFGGRVGDGWKDHFNFGGKGIKVVGGYRYLGIELRKNLSWNDERYNDKKSENSDE